MVASFAAGDGVGFVLQQSIVVLLPLIVIATLGPAPNAYFYVAWLMAYSLNFIAIGLAQALAVEGSRNPGGLARSTSLAARHMFVLLVPAILLVWFLGPLLLNAIGPQYGAEATSLLRTLAISTVPSGIAALWLAVARVRRQTGRIALAQAVNAIVAVGLTVVLLREFGIVGAGVAWLASQTIIAGGLTLAGVRQIRRESIASEPVAGRN
jgi:O-antigen/teichoic acid export membrane protein